MKFNKLTLIKETKTEIIKYIQDKIEFKNVTTFFQLVKVFNLTDCSTTALKYIERYFTMLVESNSLIELDYDLFVKIVRSSELNVDTEIEVFQAANKWLSHNIAERSKFATELLLKVRLTLLSDHALNHIINKPSSFSKHEDCVGILKEVLYNKENFVRKSSSLLSKHRYCNQKKTNILICGGFDVISRRAVDKVTQIDGNNFENAKILSSMSKRRERAKTVCLKGNVYVFGGFDENNRIMTIEKYSLLDDCWSNVSDMYDNRTGYCICSFMNKLYIIGGYNKCSSLLSALQFDPNCTSNNKWNEVARMNQARDNAACVVFEGKIVVSGGLNINYRALSTVESYDVIGNEWLPMANMINTTYAHSLVAVRNKLFVFGCTETCEVFDSSVNRFVLLKPPSTLFGFQDISGALSVGSRILIFKHSPAKLFSFDFVKNEWKEETFEVTKDVEYYDCLKLPKI